jgi:hypothetical protein
LVTIRVGDLDLGSSEVGRASWGSHPACLEKLLGLALIGELYLFILLLYVFMLLFIEQKPPVWMRESEMVSRVFS